MSRLRLKTRLNPKLFLIYVIFAVLFLVSASVMILFNNTPLKQEKSISPYNKEIHIAYYNNSASPIYIDALDTGVGAHNWSWAQNQPWCTGNGTWDAPYIIENLTINAQNLTSGIRIKNSNKPFIIRNCTLLNGTKKVDEGESVAGGLVLENATNGLLYNNTLTKNVFFGIGLQSSYNNTIRDNTASENGQEGIHLVSFAPNLSSNNTITNNTIFDNGNNGITLTIGCNNNTISHNSIINNFQGINLYQSHYNTLYNNSISQNRAEGIRLSRSNYTWIVNNNISFNEAHGIDISQSYYSDIINNTICKNEANGIFLENSFKNTLFNNTVSENDNYNIYLYSSNNNSVISNTLFNGSYSLNLYKSNYTHVSLNLMYRNVIGGVYIKFGLNNTISNNSIVNNKYHGVHLSDSNDNTIERNNITANGEHGVYLSSSDSNRIEFNNITYNSKYGIYLVSSDENTIAYNTLAGNGEGSINEINSINNDIHSNFYMEGDTPPHGGNGSNGDGVDGFGDYLGTVVLVSVIGLSVATPFVLLYLFRRKIIKLRKLKKLKKLKNLKREKKGLERLPQEDIGEETLEQMVPPEEEPRESEPFLDKLDLDEYEQFRLEKEKQDLMDQETLNKIDDELLKVNELSRENQYDEAIELLNELIPLSEDLFDAESKEDTLGIINDLITDIMSKKNDPV